QNRPWSGETVKTNGERLPRYDPDCYLCPGNTRVSGARNPLYSTTFFFDNDHPCVGLGAPPGIDGSNGVFRRRHANGIVRVVCYSPRHDISLAEIDQSEIETVVGVWQDEYVDLGKRPEIAHVLVFENKGEVVGVSNPHPHCQIYATNFVFKNIETEAAAGERYLADTGRVLFRDIVTAERQDGRRIVHEGNSSIAFIPYFARYAYEVYVAPMTTHSSLASLS